MTRYPTCLRTLLTLLIVLCGVSASQAGLFGRWRVRYDEPACPPATVSTPHQASIPAAGQPAVASAGPTVYTAAKPVVNAAANGTAAPTPPIQGSGSYVPTTGFAPSAGWSTMPRSSWDFGKFPPYSN